MDAALMSLLNQGSAWVLGGVVPHRRGNRHPSITPYETYETADRPIALAVGNDRLFARLCEALGLPELPGDERFATNSARVEHADELAELLEAVLRTRPAGEWFDALRAAAVPAGPDQRRRRGVRARRVARHGAGRRGRRLPAAGAAAAARRRAPARCACRRRGSTSTAPSCASGCSTTSCPTTLTLARRGGRAAGGARARGRPSGWGRARRAAGAGRRRRGGGGGGGGGGRGAAPAAGAGGGGGGGGGLRRCRRAARRGPGAADDRACGPRGALAGLALPVPPR